MIIAIVIGYVMSAAIFVYLWRKNHHDKGPR